MKVNFDSAKNAANLAKHGVSLDFASEVLSDENRLDVLDIRADYAEERLVSYGLVADRVWVCVFTRRSDAYRIISVRKANDRETQRYRDTPR